MHVSNKTKIFIVLVTAISLYFIGASISLRDVGDDSHFVKMLNGTDIITLLSSRYVEWSGRLALEFLMFTTIKYEIFWKIAIPLCILLLCSSAWDISMREKVSPYIGISVCIFLFMLITPSVNADASWWVTGFYNYLLPVSFGAFSIAAFMHGKGGIAKLLSIASLLIACFSEQVAILVMTSSIILSISDKRKDLYSIIFILTSIIITLILLLAPGNAIRFAYEIPHWLPDFANYGLIMKLTLGLDRLSHHLSDRNNILLLLSSIGILILSFGKVKNKGAVFYFACLILALKVVFWSFPETFTASQYFYYPYYLIAEIWSDKYIYFSYAINIATILSMAYLVISMEIINRDKALMTFLILGGCATVMMLGFSPTVYASAQRILFVFDVMQMMLLSSMIKISSPR